MDSWPKRIFSFGPPIGFIYVWTPIGSSNPRGLGPPLGVPPDRRIQRGVKGLSAAPSAPAQRWAEATSGRALGFALFGPWDDAIRALAARVKFLWPLMATQIHPRSASASAQRQLSVSSASAPPPPREGRACGLSPRPLLSARAGVPPPVGPGITALCLCT